MRPQKKSQQVIALYVGTMSENDFSPAGDDSDVIYKQAVAAYKLHKELK